MFQMLTHDGGTLHPDVCPDRCLKLNFFNFFLILWRNSLESLIGPKPLFIILLLTINAINRRGKDLRRAFHENLIKLKKNIDHVQLFLCTLTAIFTIYRLGERSENTVSHFHQPLDLDQGSKQLSLEKESLTLIATLAVLRQDTSKRLPELIASDTRTHCVLQM